MKGVAAFIRKRSIDTYCTVALPKVYLAKLYTEKKPITAADLLNDRVLLSAELHLHPPTPPEVLKRRSKPKMTKAAAARSSPSFQERGYASSFHGRLGSAAMTRTGGSYYFRYTAHAQAMGAAKNPTTNALTRKNSCGDSVGLLRAECPHGRTIRLA